MIEVREHYAGTSPAPWVRPTVERILQWLPFEYQNGISAVLLVTDRSLPKSARGRRKRSDRKAIALGAYHHKSRRGPAWIELSAEQIPLELAPSLRRLQIFRDMAVGKVLLHEVGHHLTATNRAIGRDPEASANAWQHRLLRMYFRDKYWYLRPLRPVLQLAALMIRPLRSAPATR